MDLTPDKTSRKATEIQKRNRASGKVREMNALDVDLKIMTRVNSALHMEKHVQNVSSFTIMQGFASLSQKNRYIMLMKTAVLVMMIFMLAALRL